LDEKSGEATTMQTSWRMHGKVVARKERLKISFATYIAPATWRINTRRLRGKPMRVSDRFVVGLVELGERHNQMHGAEYYKPKT
jgi:hypothetical protein